jgi:hypothetical protein
MSVTVAYRNYLTEIWSKVLTSISPKPDCVACTEAKQHVEPFPKVTKRLTEPSELTHVDLWGKYTVNSINGNKYYLAMVDNANWYITVNFCKEKSDVAQLVVNYLAHQIMDRRMPKAIQIDWGKEFENQKLCDWCHEKGIELRLMAPYSPSQNGIVEQMNWTLEELAQVMLAAQSLPEFLWEHATLHATYIRNHSYTKHLKMETPYQGWFNQKPNIAHLHEFGAPVWILLQGQQWNRKMLPRLKQQIYVGYNEGSKSLKFYSAETWKVLISRNYQIINAPPNPEPPEPVKLVPNMCHEGESDGDSMLQLGLEDQQKSQKRKCTEEDQVDTNEPWNTWGIHTNYQWLQDPFKYSNILEAEEEAYAIVAGDELTSLNKAKGSQDWPECQKAMNDELQLLNEKGTWELVNKPPDAVLLLNKYS